MWQSWQRGPEGKDERDRTDLGVMGGRAHKEGRERERETERENNLFHQREERQNSAFKVNSSWFHSSNESGQITKSLETYGKHNPLPTYMSQWQCKSGETGILICPEEHTRETGVLICPEEHTRSTGIPICPEEHTGGTGILICPAEHTGGTGILICSEEHSRGTGILTSLWATGEIPLLFEPLENFQLLTILLLKRNMAC